MGAQGEGGERGQEWGEGAEQVWWGREAELDRKSKYGHRRTGEQEQGKRALGV